MSMPELSPLVAPTLVCPDCGDLLKPKPVKAKRGHKEIVTHLEYRHLNKDSGCGYVIQSSERCSFEMLPLREDGTVVKLS